LKNFVEKNILQGIVIPVRKGTRSRIQAISWISAGMTAKPIRVGGCLRNQVNSFFPRRIFLFFLLAGLSFYPLWDSAAAGAELTLEEAIRLALEQNERPRIAEQRSMAAESRVDQARAFFFPDLSLSGSYLRQDSDVGRTGSFSNRDEVVSAAVSANLRILDARLFPLYRQAKLERRAARLDELEENRLLAFEVADAFLRTLSIQQVQASAERRLLFARNTVEDTRARFEAKLVSVNDLTRAELELAIAEREASLAEGESREFLLQLGYLIHARIVEPLEARVLFFDPPEPGDPERLVEEARERRLDLAADEARRKGLEAFALEPAMRFIPSLGATGQIEEVFEEGPNERDWFVGLDLTWLLYDGGERMAQRSERKALARIVGLELEAARRQVDLDVRRALIAMQKERAVAHEAEKAVEIGRQNAEEITVLYRQGLATALQVADANVRLFEAEVALAQARYGLGLSLLNLRAARGLDPLEGEVAK
jgi:outer membrane protein TolC